MITVSVHLLQMGAPGYGGVCLCLICKLVGHKGKGVGVNATDESCLKAGAEGLMVHDTAIVLFALSLVVLFIPDYKTLLAKDLALGEK